MRGLDLRVLFEASPNAYVVVDRELRVVLANQAYLALTGSRLDQLVGTELLQAFPNDANDPNDASRQLLRRSLVQVFETGRPDHLAIIPYRVPRAPGEEPELRVWSATHTPIKDADGRTTHVLQHTEDVSELDRQGVTAQNVLSRAKHVQTALDEHVRDLRSLFEQTPGFTAFLRGPEHVFELANPGYTQLVGGRDVIGKAIREALPELGAQGYFELLDRVLATGEPFVGHGMRVDLFDRHGKPYVSFLDFIYQPIFGRDGTAIGVLVQGHDITEQRLASQSQHFIARATEVLAMKQPEEALVDVAWAAVADLADWAVVDLFEDGTSRRLVVAHADPALAELARELTAFPIPAELPAGHVVMAPLRYGGRLYGVFVAHTAHRGRLFDERIAPVMAELGRLAATALDNARLGREREALLASEHAARERAEAASKAKDEFIALLGHELRNPLAPILSAVQLLRQRGENREIEVIERQTRHLVRLVDDLLDVSRIVHGKIDLRRERVRISDTVQKAVELATPQLMAKRHELAVATDPELVVIGDDVRLAQVVANLLTNAARYTPDGGHIEVTARREGAEAAIAVRDNGIGIAPEMLPSIFDMFVQAPQPSDRASGGLGIGLTLVRKLAELHGGSATAASAGLGQGTEVTVRIPLAANGVRTTTEQRAAVAPMHRRVLIVDDNVDAAELLGDLLTACGHSVEIAHDGEDALARLTRTTFDVALVDIGLPRMDGHQLARAIHQAHAAPPYLIAITGYGAAEDRERSRAAGFAAHLTKPVDVAPLLELLAALDMRSAHSL